MQKRSSSSSLTICFNLCSDQEPWAFGPLGPGDFQEREHNRHPKMAHRRVKNSIARRRVKHNSYRIMKASKATIWLVVFWLVAICCHQFFMFPEILGFDYHLNWLSLIFFRVVAEAPDYDPSPPMLLSRNWFLENCWDSDHKPSIHVALWLKPWQWLDRFPLARQEEELLRLASESLGKTWQDQPGWGHMGPPVVVGLKKRPSEV